MSPLRRVPSHCVAALLLAIHVGLLGWSAAQHSPSIDEVGHMAAGVSHWRFGSFDLYRVNPPLVRLLATLPVVFLEPEANWDSYSSRIGVRPEFDCGDQFIAANGRRSFWLFMIARWACIPLSVLGGYVCYRWAGELYGKNGGLLALTLWCFCPNILGHAQMITPDLGATALGAAASYLFWRWLRQPDWRKAIMAGAALGLAEMTKTTFVVLYALWPATWLLWSAANASSQTSTGGDTAPRVKWRREWIQLTVIVGLSVYVINMGYAYEGSFQRLGAFDFASEALGAADMAHAESWRRNRFAGTPLGGVPVPLPANYILGIDQQKSDFEQGYYSYLAGDWRYGGWWYYYLYGLAIKVPLGTWILAAMALGSPWLKVAMTSGECRATNTGQPSEGALGRGAWCAIRGTTASQGLRHEFVLLVPAVAIIALVSSQTGFNHHLRYVLPALPFVFIWIGRLGREWADPHWDRTPHGSRFMRCLAIAALTWSVSSSLWYFPHSLSYFNELVGGPLGGRWHMLDSNLDWGQDLLYLDRWLADHPQAAPLGLAYFGYFDPRVAGIEFSVPPLGVCQEDTGADASHSQLPRNWSTEEVGPRPGWYAISVMLLHGYRYGIPDGRGGKFYLDRPYFTYFQRFTPVARAGYSIYIYHLEPAEVNRVRREFGLAALGDVAESDRSNQY